MKNYLNIHPHFFYRYLPTLIVLITIMYLSLGTFTAPDDPFFKLPYFDKIIHATLYFTLTAIFLFDFYRYPKHGTKISSKIFVILIFVFLWGGTMEIAQKLLTQNRSADWFDFLANVVGAILGILFGYFILRPLINTIKQKKSKKK